MKPASFFDLPWALQENLLWDIRNLDYCPYESSRAECVQEISNGYLSGNNKDIINNFYQTVSVEHLQLRAEQVKEDYLREISALDKIIG